MMNRTHAAMGAAMWLGSLAITQAFMHERLPLGVDAASTLIVVGASIWPDIDHTDSVIAHVPGMRPVCAVVNRLAHGHREDTHTIAFALCSGAVSLLTLTAGAIGVGVATGIGGFLAARAMSILDMRRSLR